MYHVRAQHNADELFHLSHERNVTRSVAHEIATLRAITRLDTTVCPEKGRKTTAHVQRARAPPRWTGPCQRSRARQALDKSWTDSPFCEILKNIPPVLTFTTALKFSSQTKHCVSKCCSHEFWLLYSPYPRTHPRRTESWRIGDGDFTFDAWNTRIVCMSRGPPSNGVCSRDLVMSRASSESRISPLTASAVTRATTSLHKDPPFIVVRLVRELMSVRVHAARFLPPARPISCSIRGRLTPFGQAPK